MLAWCPANEGFPWALLIEDLGLIFPSEDRSYDEVYPILTPDLDMLSLDGLMVAPVKVLPIPPSLVPCSRLPALVHIDREVRVCCCCFDRKDGCCPEDDPPTLNGLLSVAAEEEWPVDVVGICGEDMNDIMWIEPWGGL